MEVLLVVIVIVVLIWFLNYLLVAWYVKRSGGSSQNREMERCIICNNTLAPNDDNKISICYRCKNDSISNDPTKENKSQESRHWYDNYSQ
jgi:hypothetical protein